MSLVYTRVFLKNYKLFDVKQNKDIATFLAVKLASELICKNHIVAIKSKTGFHLVASCLNEDLIKRLRLLKNRPTKPFAIMLKNISKVRKYAFLTNEEKRHLVSTKKPIVLLKSKDKLPKLVNPYLNTIGVFLPHSKIYECVFKFIDIPLIVTSANISKNPPILDIWTLVKYNLCDYILYDDFCVKNQKDDSLLFLVDKRPVFVRLSRAYRPKTIKSSFDNKGCFLALGGEEKCEFAIYNNGKIFLSPYIGDIKNEATLNKLIDSINKHNLDFDFVVCDKHPHFLHTNHFKTHQRVFVQHHHAHALSVMGEHDLYNAVAFCFDGTGYFDNNTIWGGEVLKCSGKDYKRVAFFDEFVLMPNAISNIKLLAFSIIKKYELYEYAKDFLIKITKNEEIVYQNRINCLKTSSLGRIFDAFGAIVFGFDKNEYDGFVGMAIESFYDKKIKKSYKFHILEDGRIDFRDAFVGAFLDDKVTACSKFLNMIVKIVLHISKQSKHKIVFCGGVFLNKTLIRLLDKEFKKYKMKYYIPNNFCQNDSNIAYGQIMYCLRSANV